MAKNLAREIVRIAHKNPELRGVLLPLLKEASDTEPVGIKKVYRCRVRFMGSKKQWEPAGVRYHGYLEVTLGDDFPPVRVIITAICRGGDPIFPEDIDSFVVSPGHEDKTGLWLQFFLAAIAPGA